MSYLPEGGAYKEEAEGANRHGPPLLFNLKSTINLLP